MSEQLALALVAPVVPRLSYDFPMDRRAWGLLNRARARHAETFRVGRVSTGHTSQALAHAAAVFAPGDFEIGRKTMLRARADGFAA